MTWRQGHSWGGLWALWHCHRALCSRPAELRQHLGSAGVTGGLRSHLRGQTGQKVTWTRGCVSTSNSVEFLSLKMKIWGLPGHSARGPATPALGAPVAAERRLKQALWGLPTCWSCGLWGTSHPASGAPGKAHLCHCSAESLVAWALHLLPTLP